MSVYDIVIFNRGRREQEIRLNGKEMNEVVDTYVKICKENIPPSDVHQDDIETQCGSRYVSYTDVDGDTENMILLCGDIPLTMYVEIKKKMYYFYYTRCATGKHEVIRSWHNKKEKSVFCRSCEDMGEDLDDDDSD
jgi:hypothetical protein